ncbi:MAG: type II toxin-antitoxin system Phd/YefM family antitoxin [Cyanobacteria bacterium REEB65]|nr:type II toxin-antitoxin system Phd/YefM family antitoxin [Cyanobacteria bacterium REEB65]
MIRLNIHEAKTHLSRYLDRLAKGEVILLCKRNVPIAEIRPLPTATASPRALGYATGWFAVPDDINEPLSGEELAAWEGREGRDR